VVFNAGDQAIRRDFVAADAKTTEHDGGANRTRLARVEHTQQCRRLRQAQGAGLTRCWTLATGWLRRQSQRIARAGHGTGCTQQPKPCTTAAVSASDTGGHKQARGLHQCVWPDSTATAASGLRKSQNFSSPSSPPVATYLNMQHNRGPIMRGRKKLRTRTRRQKTATPRPRLVRVVADSADALAVRVYDGPCRSAGAEFWSTVASSAPQTLTHFQERASHCCKLESHVTEISCGL
jgi:hypothetical protein